MLSAQEITLIVYNIALIPVIFFSVLSLLFVLLNILNEDGLNKRFKKLKTLPFVSVQIPTFNDPIAARCIRRCMNFNYPKDKYEIIIVDDSTNKQTQALMKKFADDNPGFIKYAHRENRQGFKPGALKEAMKYTKGEILVLFDADWMPKKDFLKRVLKPFSDPEVAIVQTRQGFYNKDTNLITRFAAYLLMVYHTIMMPINNKINCVFFCGTAGAIRRSVFDKVGGWNANSLTEDSELSVRILEEGYKTVYLKMETPSEVPDTFESFIKQQMRWCYGNARVFFDNARAIIFSKKLSFKQKLLITYITLGNFVAPLVIIMTFFGFSGWFLGDPQLLNFFDLVDFFARFLFTAGFLLLGIMTLYKHKMLKDTGKFMLAAFSLGLILAGANAVAFIKAAFNKTLHWYCTPKIANESALK